MTDPAEWMDDYYSQWLYGYDLALLELDIINNTKEDE